jgi:outer membrane protein TolC
VDEEAVKTASDHLAEAKAFYSVGTRAQIDVTKAEVDLANANVSLITVRNQVKIAKLQLENAMGIGLPSSYRIQQEFDTPSFTMSWDSVNAITMQRYDILSAEARVSANKALVTSAWAQHLPTLTATGNYTWTNFNFPLLSRWTAGLTITLPIFQGFAITSQVDQARANVNIAEANLNTIKQALTLETEQDFLGLKNAEERLDATSKIVEQAKENLNLAEKQYAAGVGSALEVADAQLTLSNARITRIQSLFDYNSSLVRLKKAMGTLVQ